MNVIHHLMFGVSVTSGISLELLTSYVEGITTTPPSTNCFAGQNLQYVLTLAR
jgi:hypothetical protein